jgi:hypothetical protein
MSGFSARTPDASDPAGVPDKTGIDGERRPTVKKRNMTLGASLVSPRFSRGGIGQPSLFEGL